MLNESGDSEYKIIDSLNFNNLRDWIIKSNYKIINRWHNHSLKIKRDTKILWENGNLFKWEIDKLSIVSSKILPKLAFDVSPLRAINISSKTWDWIYFSIPALLTMSTKWLSKNVRLSDLYIYSYNEKTKKYDLENNKRDIDSKKQTISVEVSHLTSFVLVYWETLRWSATKNKLSDFSDISNHWSRQYIETLFWMWVLKNNDNYFPNRNLTRAELIKIALETFDYWSGGDLSNIDFWDIRWDEWFSSYLAQAVELGIIDKPRPTSLRISYIKSWYDILNVQTILKFLWYNIEITWIEDEKTTLALIKYQKDNWLTNPQWRILKWTIWKLNNEIRVKNTIDNNGWYIKSNFRPWDSVNRAEALKIIIKASWINLSSWSERIFDDVKKQDWYFKYVNTANLNKIVSWYWNWKFGPWDNVTRGQISKIAVKAYEIYSFQ